MTYLDDINSELKKKDPETGLYPDHENYRIHINGESPETRVLLNVLLNNNVQLGHYQFVRAGEGTLLSIAGAKVDMIEKISKLEMQYERSQGNVPS